MDLSVRDSAQLLKVSEKTIYRWVKQGKLPAYRVNEQYRFNLAELLEWATSQRINVSADIFAEPDNGARSPACVMPSGRVEFTIVSAGPTRPPCSNRWSK